MAVKLLKKVFKQTLKTIYSYQELFLCLCVKQLLFEQSRALLDFEGIQLNTYLKTSAVDCLLDMFQVRFDGYTECQSISSVTAEDSVERKVLSNSFVEKFIEEYKEFPFMELDKLYRVDADNVYHISVVEYLDYRYQYIFILADIIVKSVLFSGNVKVVFDLPCEHYKLLRADFSDLFVLMDYGNCMLHILGPICELQIPYLSNIPVMFNRAFTSFSSQSGYRVDVGHTYFLGNSHNLEDLQFVSFVNSCQKKNIFRSFEVDAGEDMKVHLSSEKSREIVYTAEELSGVRLLPVSHFLFCLTESGAEVELGVYLDEQVKQLFA